MEIKLGLRNATMVGLSLVVAFVLGMRCVCDVKELNAGRAWASDGTRSAVFDLASTEWLSASRHGKDDNCIELPSYGLIGYVKDVDTRAKFPHFSICWNEDQQAYLVNGENLRTRRERVFIDFSGRCWTGFEDTSFEDTFFR